MDPNHRYRIRCTVDDCDFAPTVAGPDTDAGSPLIWVVFRAHCDQAHRGVRHPTAYVANIVDPTDHRELIL